jgi:hypothetical protein
VFGLLVISDKVCIKEPIAALFAAILNGNELTAAASPPPPVAAWPADGIAIPVVLSLQQK